jgi:hypothetical protein
MLSEIFAMISWHRVTEPVDVWDVLPYKLLHIDISLRPRAKEGKM